MATTPTVQSEPTFNAPVPAVTPLTRAAIVGWAAVFAVLSSLNIVAGLETALHFSGSAIDGPFQLYNSLRRIAVGQTGGVDFQFFHGLAIPYLHYPVFLLFGATFQASEVARQLVSGLLYPITVLIFLRVFLGDWARTLAWATAVIAASIAFRMLTVLVAINSLLGVRSTLATLLPVALCAPVGRWTRVLLAALMLGGALVLGTEQGLAAALGIILATAIAAGAARDRARCIVDSAAIVGGGLLTLVLVLLMIGGWRGIVGALRYNFTLVPMDQYWYFGAPPNVFIPSWHVLPGMLARIPRIPITIALGFVGVGVTSRMLWREANEPTARRRFALAALSFYGLISCASLLGTYVHSYVQPLMRVLLLVGAVLLDEWFVARAAKESRRLGGVLRPVALTALAVSLSMVAMVPSVLGDIAAKLPHFVRAHLIGRQGIVYSGIWPETITSGQAVLNAHRAPNGDPPVVWSTYAGLLEARNGLFNPYVDYVIHALGPRQRAEYVDTFKRARPTLVQTMSPSYGRYESWIEETSWDFYAELLRGYDVAGASPWSLFWERRSQPEAAPQLVWEAGLPQGAAEVTVPGPPAGATSPELVLVQVEMDYHARNLLHMLPIVGNMPRYLVAPSGATQTLPITLDPFVTRSRFPLVLRRGQAVKLAWHVYSLLPGASLLVSNVRLYAVPVSDKNQKWLEAVVRAEEGSQ